MTQKKRGHVVPKSPLNVKIPEVLHTNLKLAAALSGRSVEAIVTDALHDSVDEIFDRPEVREKIEDLLKTTEPKK